MHAKEMELICILNMLRRAGVRCTSTLRNLPWLFSQLTSILPLWMSIIPLRSQTCLSIIQQYRTTPEDVGGDILNKLLEPERRMDRNTDKPLMRRLYDSLHPQLDLVLACNADKGAREAIPYLVSICQSYCRQMARHDDPSVPTDPAEIRICSDAASTAASCASATIDEELVHLENAIAIARCLDGKDVLRDFAILGMKGLNMTGDALADMLLSQPIPTQAQELVISFSERVGIDCTAAMGFFLSAAAEYRLPESYRKHPATLRSKLYRVTNPKAMAKLESRMMDVLA